MRTTWIALIALACMMPVAADAARRDERANTTRAASQVVKPSTAAKVERGPARSAAAPTRSAAPSRAAATRQAAVTRRAAVPARTASNVRVTAPSRMAARPGDRREVRQLAMVRPGDRRGMRQMAMIRPGEARARSGFFMRVASAATLPRESNRRNGFARDGISGWQAGLPRADYSQQSCPAGTFATLARGHDDVVRCMPI